MLQWEKYCSGNFGGESAREFLLVPSSFGFEKEPGNFNMMMVDGVCVPLKLH
jgi:hypothetical protein